MPPSHGKALSYVSTISSLSHVILTDNAVGLDKSTLRDAALNAQENVSDAKEFKVEFHSSFLWIERAKSLPLDTSLNPPTRSKSAVLPFSSDYHIISFPKTDGRHHNHGSVGRFFKKIFPGH